MDSAAQGCWRAHARAKKTIGPNEVDAFNTPSFSACLLAHGRKRLTEAALARTERAEAQIKPDDGHWSPAAELALAWFEAWHLIDRSHVLDEPLAQACKHRKSAQKALAEMEGLKTKVLRGFEALCIDMDELRPCFHTAPGPLFLRQGGWLSPFERIAAFDPQAASHREWNTLIQHIRADVLRAQFERIDISSMLRQFWLRPERRSGYAAAIRSRVLPKVEALDVAVGNLARASAQFDDQELFVEQRCKEIDAWWLAERFKATCLPFGLLGDLDHEIRHCVEVRPSRASEKS